MFRLRTLGDVALTDRAGSQVRPRTRKALLLLACLATTGDGWARERLASMLWADRQEEQARNSLRTALSDLRRVLGHDAIVVDGGHVRLAAGAVVTDLDDLRGRERAGADPGELRTFYGGEFLAGADGDLEAVDWLAAARAQARDLAAAAIASALDGKTLPSVTAIQRARDLLSLDPLDEAAHRRLMRLYADNGDRSRALAQFQSCRQILRTELDIEPSAETRHLADQIAIRDEHAVPDIRGIADAGQTWRPAGVTTEDKGISIAVLPFLNMSGDADQDYFADGMSEDIAIELAKVGDVSVVATGATRMYRMTRQRPDEIAAELGVRYVLDGTVRRFDSALRITAALIDGQTNRQVWAERYDRRLENVFEVQTEIAASVAKAVRGKVAPSARRAVPARGTASLAAHEHYLRGRSLAKEMTRRSVELAQTAFEQAIAIDPGYALAHAGLAEVLSVLCFHYDDGAATLADAEAHGRRALALDPGLAEAHCSLGRLSFVEGRVADGEAAFARALAIAPDLVDAHLYRGLMYLAHGRAAEAIESLSRAHALDGDDLHAGMMLANCQHALGLMEEQRETAGEVLGLARRRLGGNPYDDQAAYVGAMALASLGERDEALRWANVAAAYDIEDQRWAYNVACAFAILGEDQRALDFLERTLRLGIPRRKLNWIRHVDSDWVGLRDDPRFSALFDRRARTAVAPQGEQP